MKESQKRVKREAELYSRARARARVCARLYALGVRMLQLYVKAPLSCNSRRSRVLGKQTHKGVIRVVLSEGEGVTTTTPILLGCLFTSCIAQRKYHPAPYLLNGFV